MSARRIRLVFAVVLVIYLLELPLTWWPGHEPYPAMNMPAFTLSDGKVNRTQATLNVRFADGSTESATFRDVIPSTPLETAFIAPGAFGSKSGSIDPQAASWLRSAIIAKYPDRTPVGVDVAWRVTTFTGARQTDTPLNAIYVNFD